MPLESTAALPAAINWHFYSSGFEMKPVGGFVLLQGSGLFTYMT
jgi:hypothetical protein